MKPEAMERDNPSCGLGILLRNAEISREQLASKMEVSTDSVNNWCSGRTAIGLKHLGSLVRILAEGGVVQCLIQDLIITQLERQGLDQDTLRMLVAGLDASVQQMSGPLMVVGHQLNSGSMQCILTGFHDRMESEGIEDLVYLDTWGVPNRLGYYLDFITRSRARGVVFVGGSRALSAFDDGIMKLSSRDIPMVFVDMTIKNLPQNSVVVNYGHYEATVLATEIMWEMGHRNIVALAIDRIWNQHGRVEGYRDTMERLGGKSRVVWCQLPGGRPQPMTMADRPGIGEAAELVAEDPRSTAILSLSSHATKKIINALGERGRTIGEDVFLMALGCWDWMHEFFSPVAHVALPHYETGQQAAEALLSLQKGSPKPEPFEITIPLPEPALHNLMHAAMPRANGISAGNAFLRR